MHAKLKDALFSFSLSNLCLLNVWNEVLEGNRPSGSYFRKSSDELSFLLSTVVAGFLLAACIWGAMTLVRKLGSSFLHKLSESAFLLLLVIPFSTILREILISIENRSARYVVVAIVLTVKLAFITAAVAVFLSPAKPILRFAKSFVFS